jgi:biotin carboxyl carrier protein
MSRSFVFGAAHPEITVRGRAPRYDVAHDGRSESVEVRSLPDGRLSILFADGRQISGRARRRGADEVEISTARGRRRLTVTDPLRARLSSVAQQAGGGGAETEEVRALMPGRVVDVSVAAGDSVEAGGLLLVLEAMKMQNELRATHAGVVLQCAIAAGQTVDTGALLLTIQPAR